MALSIKEDMLAPVQQIISSVDVPLNITQLWGKLQCGDPHPQQAGA
jgi:hypothetical protein